MSDRDNYSCSLSLFAHLKEETMQVNIRYLRDYFAQTKLKKVLVWVFQIGLTVALAAVISLMFCQTAALQEGSMDPSFSAGDKFLVNRAVYRITSPKRGDVIAFRTSDDEKASTHIKRVIGVPGDTIQIKDGNILINGETYVEERDVPASSMPVWQRNRSLWRLTSILCWETTATAVWTAVLRTWGM